MSEILTGREICRRRELMRDAAAELYEALAEMHRCCLGTPVGGGDGGTYVVGHPNAAIMNKALAAMLKARGES